MLQVIQHQKTGAILVEELPAPQCLPGGVLVRVLNSLISAGTERTSVSKAQSSLLERAMKQPQEVAKVLESVRKDGIKATFRKVQGVLDSYKPLGYSASGIVIESQCTEFKPGDRVACAGNKYAFHAEIITVPKNLVVRIPENVAFDNASYTTLGAIAMQGVRQAGTSIELLGANVAVIGLGLLGQITVQLLNAAGSRVIGLDVNETLFIAAKKFGAELVLSSDNNAVKSIEGFTRGLGVDAVIITAATDSNEPVDLALNIARKRGVVVVVGAVGMNIPRSPFYEKELEFKISCSYGPGRYDSIYEEQGVDYPVGYVRWTENRNMQSFLDLIAAGKVDVRSMTTHTFTVQEAAKAYDLIMGVKKEPYSGVVLSYLHQEHTGNARIVPNLKSQTSNLKSHHCHIGFIGAGSFAQAQLLPPLKSLKARMVAVATNTPITAKSVAERFGFENFATDAEEVIKHSDVTLLFCASRHESHAGYVIRAIEEEKPIFVEKPLAISHEQLVLIDAAIEQYNGHVMVGFNRRFSAPFKTIKEAFKNRVEPMAISYRVNAGYIPSDNWVQEPLQGGRIIGEGCHFIDCMVFLTDALPVSVYAEAISTANGKAQGHDTVIITIKFSDGSIGTLQYFANGDSAVPKEYCEVFCGGKTAIMNNFKTVEIAQGKRIKSYSFNGTKGHQEEIRETIGSLQREGRFPIEYNVLRSVTLATFAAEVSLQTGLPKRL